MPTEMGEYVVGAYLKLCCGCDFVQYNVRPSEGGLAGLAEIDVVGLDLANNTAYLCEATTHLGGIGYGYSYEDTAARIKAKYKRLQEYAGKSLHKFSNIKYMFWSPCVPKGRLLEMLRKNKDLEII
jgi:hypothetical protein